MTNKRLLPAYLLTFVNVLGFSILMPVLPFIIEDYGAPEWVYGLMLTLYAGSMFLGSPYLGSMSDRIGRKPVLVVSHLGTLSAWILFLIALNLPDFKLFGVAGALLLIGASRILDGITGGNSSVANAYVSDITTPQEKAYIFGALSGIAGLGMILGPGLGGVMAGTSLGYTGTILASIVISVLTLIAIMLWLRESNTHREKEQKRKNLLSGIFILKRIRQAEPSSLIKRILLMRFLFAATMAFYISTIVLFVKDLFEFNELQLGMFMFVVGLFLAFNQAVVSRFFIKKWGVFQTLVVGLLLTAIGFIAITVTTNLWLYFGFYYILNLGFSLCFPTFNAMIALHANPTRQGEMMGISESLQSLANALIPVLGAYLYGLLNYQLYWMLVLLPLVGLVLARPVLKTMKNSSRQDGSLADVK